MFYPLARLETKMKPHTTVTNTGNEPMGLRVDGHEVVLQPGEQWVNPYYEVSVVYYIGPMQVVFEEPTDTSFDFEDEDTLPGYSLPAPIASPHYVYDPSIAYPINKPVLSPSNIADPCPRASWVSYKDGDDLPNRKCRSCGNHRMKAVYMDQNWYAFCRLCGRRESL